MLDETWAAPISGQFEFVRMAEMRGADKNVRASREVRFESMSIGRIEYPDALFRFSDNLASGRSSPDMDGLLGFRFLSARPTSINFRARQLRVW